MPQRGSLGAPSARSAVIVRAHLSDGLERLRRRSVGDAADGVPAHVTLLYPFIEPDRLRREARASLAAIAGRHEPFDYSLAGQAMWPDTVYVRVDPVAPFVSLQADLATAFPDFPIYGRNADFAFVPHVTVAEGEAVSDPAVRTDPGWAALPRRSTATAIELIARKEDGRWRTRWRIALGRRPGSRRRAASGRR